MSEALSDPPIPSDLSTFSVVPLPQTTAPAPLRLVADAPPVEVAEAAPSSPLSRRWPRATKRALDLVLCLLALPVVVLVLPVLMLVVRLDSKGPAIFRQTRVGRGGRPITVLKLRSMHVDAEERLERDPELKAEYLAHGYKLPPGRDPRITRVGRFLRKSSLDELPQVLSVLFGSMSLVGPRPVLPGEVEVLYGARKASYLVVKPGLTGLWQVNGRSHVTKTDRALLDERYARDWALRRDVRILLRTVPAVLRAHGAH